MRGRYPLPEESKGRVAWRAADGLLPAMPEDRAPAADAPRVCSELRRPRGTGEAGLARLNPAWLGSGESFELWG